MILPRYPTANQLIRDKHDPQNLPSAYSGFRSVVSPDAAQRPHDYYNYAVASGTAVYSVHHRSTGLFFRTPPWLQCGSAIPSGSAMPTQAMDGYYVAQAFTQNAHIFAEKESRILAGIAAEKFTLLL